MGCGPGTITVDLAALVAPGRVVGIDRSVDVVDDADVLAHMRKALNLTVSTGDVYALEPSMAPPSTWCTPIRYSSTSRIPLPHCAKMRRTLRPGGLVAVRDADYGAFVWSPEDPLLTRWVELYHQVTARTGPRPTRGAICRAGCAPAGFEDLVVTTSTWTFADPQSRAVGRLVGRPDHVLGVRRAGRRLRALQRR